MLKYIFLGSPPFARSILEKLAADYQPPSLVVSQARAAQGRGQKIKSTAVAEFAQSRGIRSLETADVNQSGVLEELRKERPDVLVVVAFGQILSEAVLAIPRIFAINLHASLLPKYRGAAPIQRAIWAGDSETGVTIQKMVKQLDAGECLLQKRIDILASDTTSTLLQRLVAPSAETLRDSMNLLESGKYTLVHQDDRKASYAPKLEKTDSRIQWERTNIQIHNQIRAAIPWPICQCALGDHVLKIFCSEAIDGEGAVGKVFSDRRSYLHVQCGKGRLALTVIQPANRKPMNIAQFLSGYRGPLELML